MIIRRHVNSNFTVVPNEPVTDARLGFAALGLLTYLLSRPDHWQVRLCQLQERGGIGRDKMQGVMNDLITLGYVVRQQRRDDGTNQFGTYEYVVYDEPTRASPPDAGEPQPENQVTGICWENDPQPEKPWPEKPWPENPHLVNTDSSKSLREDSVSNETGGEPPSVNAEIWKEGLSLLVTTFLSDKQSRKIIGQWCKRAPSQENKKTLLAILRAARRAGTGDPVAYIAKAVNDTFPPPPDPGGFDDATWRRSIQAALNMRSWSPAWGPPPGAKGCKVPAAMITGELVEAVKSKRRAA